MPFLSYLMLNNIVSLKSRLAIIQGHRKLHHLIDRIGYEFLFVFHYN